MPSRLARVVLVAVVITDHLEIYYCELCASLAISRSGLDLFEGGGGNKKNVASCEYFDLQLPPTRSNRSLASVRSFIILCSSGIICRLRRLISFKPQAQDYLQRAQTFFPLVARKVPGDNGHVLAKQSHKDGEDRRQCPTQQTTRLDQ